MPATRLGAVRTALVVGLAALTLGPGLGGSGRLTYHEGIWAQAGREMLAEGAVLVPTIGGRPWLEKPPLAPWLIALSGRLAGGVGEASARAPSAVAATLLAVALAAWAARRFGPTVGLLAGLVQVTTAWLLMRGRLAEADVPLAALVAGAVLAFDRLRSGEEDRRGAWRWAFFALLGATALAKGVGFGAALVMAVVAVTLAWDRDRPALRALTYPRGWAVACLIALTWPALVLLRYPSALGLWTVHVADRLAARPEHFSGEPGWLYASALLWQTLPWTPLALVGAWPSWRRAIRQRGGPDRLLWAWAVGPAVLVSLASVRNGHYLIYALPPWSVWAASGLTVWAHRLRCRGWSPTRVRWSAVAGFAALGLAIGLGFAGLGPRLDRRGAEWAFYEAVGRRLRPDEPLALLYDELDHHKPYPSPYGPVPHDLAVRLFYLDRPACWRMGPEALVAGPPAPPPAPFAVLGRDRDVPALRRLGRVELVDRGPSLRADRVFTLFRVTPGPDRVAVRPVGVTRPGR